MRLTNELGSDDEQVEENALIALEIVSGATIEGLSWDPSEVAAAWVPRAISRQNIVAAAPYAFSPSDLLPSRPSVALKAELEQRLITWQWTAVSNRSYSPTLSDFFRSPKEDLTTRPAALLAPRDRLTLEALVDVVLRPLEGALPSHAFWPRNRDRRGDHLGFVSAPTSWESDFIIRTDIAGYYESVDHSLLAILIAENLGLRGGFPVALEAFLDAIMGARQGLPQGPPGSDVLGAAYLVDLDRWMSAEGWEVARYSDDLLIGATSFDQARLRLREIEGILRERGLRLAGPKTKILRRDTYLRNLEDARDESLFRKVVNRAFLELVETMDGAHRDEVLSSAGMSEDLLWNLLYHESVSLEEALEQVTDRLSAEWVSVYESLFAAEGLRLLGGGYADDAGALSVRDIRECLLIMAGGRARTSLDALAAVLDWHPTLVRDVANYLAALGGEDCQGAGSFVAGRIAAGSDSDLELAWIISSAVQEPRIVQSVGAALRELIDGPGYPFASAVSVRALAGAGQLEANSWASVLAKSSEALVAELLLARDAEPNGFPPNAGPLGITVGGEW